MNTPRIICYGPCQLCGTPTQCFHNMGCLREVIPSVADQLKKPVECPWSEFKLSKDLA